jgi:hypothetical protein
MHFFLGLKLYTNFVFLHIIVVFVFGHYIALLLFYMILVVTRACKARHDTDAMQQLMTIDDVSLDDHIHSWYVCI